MRNRPQDPNIPDQERASTGILAKAVCVVESRTADHELTLREFRLGASGIQVGEALTDFEGVVTGVASYKGELPLLADADSAGAA